GPHLVTKLIAAFQRAYPGLRVSLSLGNAAAAWDNLALGRADVVVAADAPNTPANHTVTLQHSRLVVVVAADHPWASRDKVALGDLAGERTVVRERRSNTQRMVNKLLRRRRVTLGHRLELDSREAVIEAVAAGLGIGFIFASEAPPDPRIRTIELRGISAHNTEVVGCLQAQRRDSIVRAFLETVAGWRASGA
ncbi:MAG: LysR substrate-binding domain-containing protein, partial [Magnetovibrio sp.]|nr:LysR substrate-binding domain-containing protein [Magnetovibrio sp.]